MNFKNTHEEGMEKYINLHEGHRERLRERLDSTYFCDADDYQVLEYILQLVVKRKDTNELAHKLVNTFGSLANVCDSGVNDLIKVKGITPTMAYFLHNIPYIFRNYKLSKLKPKANLSCPQDAFNYLGECIFHLPEEEFYLICLDSSNNVINQRVVAIGGMAQVSVKLKEVLQFAQNVNASKVVLLHNHPTGNAEPSIEDIDATKRIFLNSMVNGITLYDHIIVNFKHEFYSFAQNGIIKQFEADCKSAFAGKV